MNITESFLEVTLLGAEWVLWVLIALSIASVAVMAERLIFFRRRSVDLDELKSDVEWALEADQLDALNTKYAGSAAMPARVAMRGLGAVRDGDRDAVADAMNGAKTSAKTEHERNLVFLGTLGNNAPFIGLFGTVLGIIKAFNDLANNPAGDANVVMAGISEALVATAVGLLVAIPAVVMFNYFNRRIRATVAGTDGVALAILGSMGRSRVVEMEVDLMAGGATYSTDDDDGGMISGINVTPLVDITLVLLIVFMVTAKLIAARAIPLDTPKTASGGEVTAQIELSIDADGGLYYNGEPATIVEITARIRAAARGSDEVRPIITADSTVDHGDVMAVVDSVKLAGVHKFAVTTRRKK